MRKFIFFTPSLVAAPSIVDSLSTGFSGSTADPKVFATSGLDWASGQRILSFFTLNGDQTVSDIAGDTNDTDSLILNSDGQVNNRLYCHEINVVGGALDANINYDITSTRRGCAFLLTFAGLINAVAAENAGVSVGAPGSPSISVSGTKNRLIIAAVGIRGAHVTNPPVAPTGFTLLGTVASGTNDPSSTSQSTLAVATMLANGSTNPIASAVWQGLSDIGSQPWNSIALAAEPS